MAEKLKVAMPDNLQLGGDWMIEWDAVDPTTGASVAGVVVSNTSLVVDQLSGPSVLVGNPILLGTSA